MSKARTLAALLPQKQRKKTARTIAVNGARMAGYFAQFGAVQPAPGFELTDEQLERCAARK